MRIPKLAVLLSTLLLLVFTVAATAESRSTRCNSEGRVFSYTVQHGGAFEVTLSWPKADADNDIFIFLPSTGDLIGVGVGVEARFETVKVGAVPGTPLDVLVMKYSGPNSKCYLYVSNHDGGMGGGSLRARLRYRGTIQELAQQSPRYERMGEAFERVMRAKGWEPER